MTIFGHKKVDIDTDDERLYWIVYKHKTEEVLCQVAYKLIFDVSGIKKNKDAMNALAACICQNGLPDSEILAKVFARAPEVIGKPIDPACVEMMANGLWATEKSRSLIRDVISELKALQKTDKLPNNGTQKRKKPRRMQLDEEEIVDSDEDDDSSFPEPLEIDRDIVFETTADKIGKSRRKLNI
jgi:hypothetical protein